MKNKAFTLTELLIALGIIGAIAAMSVPTLITTINNKTLAHQMKNIFGSIQQAVNDQLVINKTKTLIDTDFNTADGFYAKLQTVAACDGTNHKCWADSYNIIGGGTSTGTEELTDGGVLLGNGAAVEYIRADKTIGTDGENTVAHVYVDVNGTDSPNVIGKDLFSFYITPKGKIFGEQSVGASTCDVTSECFQALYEHNWVMPKDSEYYTLHLNNAE